MLHKLSEDLLDWLDDAGTPRDLIFLIVAFIQGRGDRTMEELVYTNDLPAQYLSFARAQDFIGWRRFLEGTVARELRELVAMIGLEGERTLSVDGWVQAVVKKLLE